MIHAFVGEGCSAGLQSVCGAEEATTLRFRTSWSNICTRMACVLGSCTSSHLSSFQVGLSVFFWCSCSPDDLSQDDCPPWLIIKTNRQA